MMDRMLTQLGPAGAAPVDDGGMQAQALAMLGREDRVAAIWAAGKIETCGTPHGGVETEPLDEIVRRARDAQVVIVNEAHDRPEGRAFIGAIAAALRPLGFAIYAAEAFSPSVGRTGPAYALESDGGYVNEPAFGELVRRVRALGYALVPYEDRRRSPPDPMAAMNAREAGEVDNLMSRVFAVDPHARVLIHVGYSHARELPDNGVTWMAARLKARTGIDPLTIDQTTFGPAGERARVCVASSDGTALDATFDLSVMPPAPRFVGGRAKWRQDLGQRLVAIPAALLRPGQRLLVEARRADEPPTATAVDRILVDPGETLPLLLPPGRFRVRARMVKGAWSPSLPIEVLP